MWQKIEQVVAANLWETNGKKCLSPTLEALSSPIPRLNLGQMQLRIWSWMTHLRNLRQHFQHDASQDSQGTRNAEKYTETPAERPSGLAEIFLGQGGQGALPKNTALPLRLGGHRGHRGHINRAPTGHRQHLTEDLSVPPFPPRAKLSIKGV